MDLGAFESPTLNAQVFCSGDGLGRACPCGNEGQFGEGCTDSNGMGGLLAASGSLSIATDDMRITCTRLPANRPALLFVGTTSAGGGGGVVFGDGLRCAGGAERRLGIRFSNSAGAAEWGPGLSAGMTWDPGETRYFQTWYRDGAGPCGSGYNLSSGLSVTFE